MLKKIILSGMSLLTAFAMMFMVPAAFAADNTTGIINSGDNADIQSEAETKTDIHVDQTNVATVQQTVDASLNTGGNDANRNIGTGAGAAADITTGNAGLNVGLAVQANRNNTVISGLAGNGGSNLTDVVNTGDDADIDASSKTKTDIHVDSTNVANVGQNIHSWMNTGYNDANRNVGGGGDITTGVAAATVGLNAALNENNVGIGTEDGLSASANSSSSMNDSLITNTGDDLEFDTDVEKETKVHMKSTNVMSVLQNLWSKTNTGKNDADRNIGGSSSSLYSGNAGMNIGAAVSGNQNNTFLGGLWEMFLSWWD